MTDKTDTETEAIAGEDLSKGEVVTLWKEGEEGEAYAYRYSPEKKQMEAMGISDRAAKKGETVKVHKAQPKVHPFYGVNTGGYYRP